MTTASPAPLLDGPAAGRDGLRAVLGRFATGVTVVTAGRDRPSGMTASSFTSVALDPPLVLLCVTRTAETHARILAEGAFAVSILAAGQAGLARHFADSGRPRGRHGFDGVQTFRGPRTGAPLLRGSLAWLECSLTAVHDGGDHSILLGSVLDLACGPSEDPLLYFGGAFRTGPPTPESLRSE